VERVERESILNEDVVKPETPRQRRQLEGLAEDLRSSASFRAGGVWGAGVGVGVRVCVCVGVCDLKGCGGECVEVERLEELALGVVGLGEGGAEAGAALAAAGGRVDEGGFVDL